MGNIQKFYDQFWAGEKSGDHNDYERDEVFESIFKKGESVLDVACGDGRSSQKIAQLTNIVVAGLEISAPAAKQAREKGIDVKTGDVQQKFPFKNKVFDSVFWGDNIEHIFDPAFTLGEIARVLKPDGRLILSTPNTAYWRYRLYYLKNGRLPDTEFDGRQPWDWAHIRFFNTLILKEFLTNGGFEITKIWGINRRMPDKYLCNILPNLFGMILVVEAVKKDYI